MSNKVFAAILAVIVIGMFGTVIVNRKDRPNSERLGTGAAKQSENHIGRGQPHEPYSTDPASSGPHYADKGAPAQWGIYTQEIPDEVFLHNEEHGGVVITYGLDLPDDQVKKLQKLFAPPYSNPNFKPTKAIVTQRSKNTKPIELASWTRTFNLDSYDENTLMQYYLTNVGKSPEPGAGPSNTPINQAN